MNSNLHKIGLNRGESYINSPKWLQNKKTTINPKNKDDKGFQYTFTVAINYRNFKKKKGYQKLSLLLNSLRKFWKKCLLEKFDFFPIKVRKTFTGKSLH